MQTGADLRIAFTIQVNADINIGFFSSPAV
jgi:hypothetical protein